MRRRDKPRNYAPPVVEPDFCLWQQFLRPSAKTDSLVTANYAL